MSTGERIDWEAVRERLEAVRVLVARGFSPSPEAEKQILKSRAQALAREPTRAADVGDLLEIVEFDLGDEHYALPLESVREVAVLKDLTPVPCTPGFVLGIINLRGEIRTVIDLKRFFDLPATGITELNKILLIERGDMRLGILADAIRGAGTVARDHLQTSLPTLTDIRADYLLGLTPDRVIILDPAKILSDPRILVDDKVPVAL